MNDKIKAVIIDDEETAIDNLCFELKKYQWISVDGIARNGKSGIRLIEKERPDLLFLDVELPDMNNPKEPQNVLHIPFLSLPR